MRELIVFTKAEWDEFQKKIATELCGMRHGDAQINGTGWTPEHRESKGYYYWRGTIELVFRRLEERMRNKDDMEKRLQNGEAIRSPC